MMVNSDISDDSYHPNSQGYEKIERLFYWRDFENS